MEVVFASDILNLNFVMFLICLSCGAGSSLWNCQPRKYIRYWYVSTFFLEFYNMDQDQTKTTILIKFSIGSLSSFETTHKMENMNEGWLWTTNYLVFKYFNPIKFIFENIRPFLLSEYIQLFVQTIFNSLHVFRYSFGYLKFIRIYSDIHLAQNSEFTKL